MLTIKYKLQRYSQPLSNIKRFWKSLLEIFFQYLILFLLLNLGFPVVQPPSSLYLCENHKGQMPYTAHLELKKKGNQLC